MEPMSFRTKEDFKIVAGPDGKEYSVKRLKYREAESVLNGLMDSSRKIGAFSMRLAAAIADAPKQNPQQREAVLSVVEGMIPALISASTFGVVRDALPKISGGVFTPEIIAEMDYDEAVKILTYLIDRNFESLKNLYASFAAISTNR